MRARLLDPCLTIRNHFPVSHFGSSMSESNQPEEEIARSNLNSCADCPQTVTRQSNLCVLCDHYVCADCSAALLGPRVHVICGVCHIRIEAAPQFMQVQLYRRVLQTLSDRLCIDQFFDEVQESGELLRRIMRFGEIA